MPSHFSSCTPRPLNLPRDTFFFYFFFLDSVFRAVFREKVRHQEHSVLRSHRLQQQRKMVQKPTAWRAKHRRSDEDGCKESWPSGSALYQPQRPQDGGEATPRPGSSPRLCSSANWSQEHHIFIQLCRSRREHSTANVNENRWSTSDTNRPRETLRRDSKLYGTRDGRQVHVQWKLYWMLTQLQLGFVDVRGCRIKT